MQAVAIKNINTKLICQAQKHPFHILSASSYPFLVSIYLLFMLIPATLNMHGLELPFGIPTKDAIHVSFLGLFATVMRWFISIVKESGRGYHTAAVQHGLRMGMILFILSEVMLFFGFFWAFFHFSLVPSVNIGAVWPPVGTQELNVWGLPLVNTLLLLTSGLTITVAHAYILRDNRAGFGAYLLMTIILGLVFLMCQAYEYKYGVKFSWRENVYGSIFFITTGFHGAHVTIGTIFLTFCLARHITAVFYEEFTRQHTTSSEAVECTWAFHPQQHFGFEAAAWYWHFVDVVWLFLFITIYWWGGK